MGWIRSGISAVVLALTATCAPAQTADGATFVVAMDRSYDFVGSGDLTAFGDWPLTAPDGTCGGCTPTRFTVLPPGSTEAISCFVLPADDDGDFRTCFYARPWDGARMPSHSPIYTADSALTDRWIYAQGAFRALPEGAGQDGDSLTWMTCPEAGRANGVVLSLYDPRASETFPAHFTVLSGTEDLWAAEFAFPDCLLYLS